MSISVEIRHAFHGFSLDIAFEAGPGVTALFGPSGAGKTTVMNAIAGLMRPEYARITREGQVLCDTARNIALPAHARRFGMVFQDARLFPHLSVQDNLTFGARYADGAQVAFDEVVALLGLEPLLSRAPQRLSGGEKQRVALGRALLSQPRMLLMDEPLAGLDGPRKEEILPYLERLRDAGPGLPILYVSHAVEEVVRLADDLVLMDAGALTAAGPMAQVLADPVSVPLLGQEEAGVVLCGEIKGCAEDATQVALSAGQIELDGALGPVGSAIKLRVRAQDVTLARVRPEGVHLGTVMPVEVEAVLESGFVRLRAGEDRLLAAISARGVAALGLVPGTACFALVKARAVGRGRLG
ncbi:MAG: molybdenum ABC transporter ATP-binding protein [Pseudomonadota bacterium]